MQKIVKLHEGDPRIGELYGAILDVIGKRGTGISFASVLGNRLKPISTQPSANTTRYEIAMFHL